MTAPTVKPITCRWCHQRRVAPCQSALDCLKCQRKEDEA